MMGKMEIRSPPGSRPRDGRHCDLCGCSQPAVRCDKCGCQIFCLSCDDMYHRHPKRRFHLRKAVDPTPPIPQARPNLPMKVSHLNATNPGDPSKMPLPPPRKKKSLFGSFRKPSPSADNSPPLPKKEYSWSDRLGSIKKFMSNRPLPPLPNADDNDMDSHPTTNGQSVQGDLSFIHKRTDERPPQLPQRSPRSPDFPGVNQEKENRIPSIQPPVPGQIRNGSVETNSNHMNHDFPNGEENHWNNQLNHQNGPQAFGTMNRQMQQRGFMPPGAPGYPGGMHQSSSATDLHTLHSADGMPGAGPVPPHYPHYPMNPPHMPPHYPYPMYPQYPGNYPQYFGNSFASLSNPPTSEGDQSDSESTSRHSSKKHPFRKRAKRSQSVMVDRMAYPGQFFPFGPYPGYGPWGAPMPMEAPPSPASSVRSLNRAGRTRRRKKMTSEDDDDLSGTSSPMSRPKSSSSDPREQPREPLATQTTSSEDESDDEPGKRRNKVNTIKRPPEANRMPSPVAVSKRVRKLKKSFSKQSDSDSQEIPEAKNERRPSDPTAEQRSRQSHLSRQSPLRSSPLTRQSPVRQSPVSQSPVRQPPVRQSPPPQQHFRPQQSSPPATSKQPDTWECGHCTYINPNSNRICQVCCKTCTSRTETPVSAPSRESTSAASNRKESVGSEKECSSSEKLAESEDRKKDKQDMASLNSALDEAEKQISKGLEELMRLKDDIDANMSKENKTKPPENQPKSEGQENSKPVYKSSGKMRTSILDKLSLSKPQTVSTSTETGQNDRRPDKIIEARRHSNSSSASETYNSPLAQSPEFDRGYLGSKQKRDSSCQTQQDSIAEYLEKRKAAEEAFLGRPINNFGFGYGDRMDMVTSPVPAMYDRFFGGGYGGGLMQRSHSRASLFTGRINDLGPMDYGPGFGYGPTPMYRSVSRGSLTGDYPDGRLSEYHNLRKPDYYLSMEELVERRRQDSIRAQGLELVRMIREAEQQGFNADDIQVALTHCGKQNPMEWLQENWRNMVDSVMTLSTNYGNDKTENDIGLLSENEARDALRLHKGNIWAAVTECVEGRQRKYLELSARGNFSRQDIVDALTSSEGDVEMAYAKLTKSTGKPFLMRIWGQGEGAQNQDGAQPVLEDFNDGPRRYLKDETLNSDEFSEELWSDDGDGVDWDEEEEFDEEERGDIEDLRTCQEDLQTSPQDMMTPESEKSEYCDAFSLDDRNASSPSDEIFFVIPETKPEKKKGFLSKLVALRKDGKEHADPVSDVVNNSSVPAQTSQSKEDSVSNSSLEQPKNGGALSALKNTLNVIKDTVTGGTKNDKKVPCAQPERRTIIVKGQIDQESPISSDSKTDIKLTSFKALDEDNSAIVVPESQSKDKFKCDEKFFLNKEVESAKEKNSEALKNSSIETDKTNTDNSTVENFAEKSEIKKSENKKSLAEKLKFAKQTRSSVDAAGPSGIHKDNSFQTDVPSSLNVDKNHSSPVPGPSGIKKGSQSLETNVKQSHQTEFQENKLSPNQDGSYPKITKEKDTEVTDKNKNEFSKSENQGKHQPERAFANVIQKNQLLRQKSIDGEIDLPNIIEAESSSASLVKDTTDKSKSEASTTSLPFEPNHKEETQTLNNKDEVITVEKTEMPLKLLKDQEKSHFSNEIRDKKSSPTTFKKDDSNIPSTKSDSAIKVLNSNAGSSKPTSESLRENDSANTKLTSSKPEESDIDKANSQKKSLDNPEPKSIDGISKKKVVSDTILGKDDSKINESTKLLNDAQKTTKQEKNGKDNSNAIKDAPPKTIINEDIKNKLPEPLENVKSDGKSEKSTEQESKSQNLVKRKTDKLLKNNEYLSENSSLSEINSDVSQDQKTNTQKEFIKNTDIASKMNNSRDEKLAGIKCSEDSMKSNEVVTAIHLEKDELNKSDDLKEPNPENSLVNQQVEQHPELRKSSAQPDQKSADEQLRPKDNSESSLNSEEVKSKPISEPSVTENTSTEQNAVSETEKKDLVHNDQVKQNAVASNNDNEVSSQRKNEKATSSQNEITISGTSTESKDTEMHENASSGVLTENNEDSTVVFAEKDSKNKDDSKKTITKLSELQENESQVPNATENTTKTETLPNTISSGDSSNMTSTSESGIADINIETEASLLNEVNVLSKENTSIAIEKDLPKKEKVKSLDSESETVDFKFNDLQTELVTEDKTAISVTEIKSSTLEKASEISSESSNNAEAITKPATSEKIADAAAPTTSKDEPLSNAKQSEEKSDMKQTPNSHSEANQNSTEKTPAKGSDNKVLQPPVFSKEFPNSKNNVKSEIPTPSDATNTAKITEVSSATDITIAPEATSSKRSPDYSKNLDASSVNNVAEGQTVPSTSSNKNNSSIHSTESITATSSDIKTTSNSTSTNFVESSGETASSSTNVQSGNENTDFSESNSSVKSTLSSSSSNVPDNFKKRHSPSSQVADSSSEMVTKSSSEILNSVTGATDSVTVDKASPEEIQQHSNAQHTEVNDSSSMSTEVSSPDRTIHTSQNNKLQRTISEDSSEPRSLESDDTDTEYSDNSFSAVVPLSPVDALRNRFETLAGGRTVRGGPIRPASPFRRMSFNSRKQAIALEKKRDTSADKPWMMKKIVAEPVKTTPPKRSIKQQLEMERKVRKMVADRKCRTYRKAEIVVQLMDMNFEEEESIQAANECSTLEQAISYLQQECLLCAGHFAVSQIVSMTHCEHKACRECIRAYFTVQIRDRTILDLLCPFCNEPDISDEDVAQDYFNHLDIMLKKLVDVEIHELFQRKLRDRVLMKDPNFRWCSQCSSGFIAEPNLTRLICPDCNAVTCASCRRLWEREHQGISCEAFAALKDASDPEAQAAGLAKMLTEDGISCPSCHFRYALAKGGCMHFRCIQCQHDFCSGCSRPFKMGQKCGVSEFCGKLGLHAHHPRNCLFYLRDKDPEDLQKLLDMNNVKYNKDLPDGMELRRTCQVMEQKETADGMVDDYCGKEVQEGYAGLCRIHYVEYLGQLVNKNQVDPIQIFDNDDLELVLRRANIRLPPKKYRESDISFREKLINVIHEELPLDKMDGS